jgi:hypothetical protein
VPVGWVAGLAVGAPGPAVPPQPAATRVAITKYAVHLLLLAGPRGLTASGLRAPLRRS